MSEKSRRKFRAEFKAQVGLEALKGVEPVHTIAAKHKVHPVYPYLLRGLAVERPDQV